MTWLLARKLIFIFPTLRTASSRLNIFELLLSLHQGLPLSGELYEAAFLLMIILLRLAFSLFSGALFNNVPQILFLMSSYIAIIHKPFGIALPSLLELVWIHILILLLSSVKPLSSPLVINFSIFGGLMPFGTLGTNPFLRGEISIFLMP